MIRLAISELRADWRLWVGPLLVILTASAISHLAITYWWSVGTPAAAPTLGELGVGVDELRAGAYVLYISAGLPTIIVLGSVAATTVDAQRVRIARWRLSGALPSQVRGVILLQLFALSLAAAILGVLVSLPFTQPVVDVMMRMGTRTNTTILAQPSWQAIGVTIALTIVLCMIGALRPAFRASRIPAVEAVRAETVAREGMTIGRWILAGLLVLFGLQQIFVSVVATFYLRDDAGLTNLGLTNAMMIGVLLVITMAVFAPLILSLVLRVWSAVVPPRLSVSWFLARYSTASRLKSSTAAITPLMVGVSLYGILFGILATWQASLAAAGSSDQLNFLDTYVMLTPAAIIAAVGSIATVFMTSRSREHEFAVLRSAGAQTRTVLGMTVAEAALYTVTAVILALVSITAAVLTIAGTLAVAGMPFTPRVDLSQALTLCALAFVGMVLAVAVPAALSTRKSTRDNLAPQ